MTENIRVFRTELNIIFYLINDSFRLAENAQNRKKIDLENSDFSVNIIKRCTFNGKYTVFFNRKAFCGPR